MEDDCGFILRLIESVEKKKCLYDKRDPFYFNRNVKERATVAYFSTFTHTAMDI